MGRCVSLIELLKDIQLDIMLVLTGICAVMVIFVLISKVFSPQRKSSLLMMTIGSMFLLIFDRFAYIYRGDTSVAGWWMVRISNFIQFSMVILIIWAFNHYIRDIYIDETGLKKIPVRLTVIDIMVIAGLLLLCISQFTGLYYTFDASNTYQRAPLFFISMAIPCAMLIMQLSVIIQFSRYFRRGLFISLILFTTLPLIAGIIQFQYYGLSLINLTTGFLAIMLYLFALKDMNVTVERARKVEFDFLKKQSEDTKRLFAQTAEALASAIDAKDPYTKGHSSRVAEYSRKIAELAGKDEQDCEEIYYAALLHDVGKIGVSRTILNKNGKLTDEEYQLLKRSEANMREAIASVEGL